MWIQFSEVTSVPLSSQQPKNKQVMYSQEKNHRQAFDVIQALRKMIPEARLACYGSGPLQTELSKFVSINGLDTFIKINGYTTDICKNYQSAGFSLLTSQGEGYCLSIIESLSEGCPVAAYRVPYGPEELIKHGHTGVLSLYGEVQRLAVEIANVMRCHEKHEAMCHSAWHAAQAVSEDKVAGQWKALLEELLLRGN